MNSPTYSDISPKYMVKLIPKIEEAIWALFDNAKYKNVRRYVLRWHESSEGYNYNDSWENFSIHTKQDSEIDLAETLHGMPNDLLIRIAIDLGVDTPGFLPVIPQFKNVLKDSNETALQSFERAIKNVYDNPDEAVSLANSALEGVIKTLLASDTLKGKSFNPNHTLYDLTCEVLKQLKMFPGKKHELEEISKIGSGLLTAAQNIESMRSTKTKSHGKLKDDYVISDPAWAIFTVNAVSTIGLFLNDFYRTNYSEFFPKIEVVSDDAPIDLSEIPF